MMFFRGVFFFIGYFVFVMISVCFVSCRACGRLKCCDVWFVRLRCVCVNGKAETAALLVFVLMLCGVFFMVFMNVMGALFVCVCLSVCLSLCLSFDFF